MPESEKNEDSTAHDSKPSLADTKAMFMSDFLEDDCVDLESDEPEPSEVMEQTVDTVQEVTAYSDMTPTVITDTTVASTETYIPLLPKPVQTEKKRQLILDTETTGLHANNGDRIIEIGVVEVINRRFTGEKLHVYIDPQRDMDPEAVAIHGITSEFLQGKPKFADIAAEVFDFLEGSEIIAHNAPFDIGFLNAEFERYGKPSFDKSVTVTDTLALAKSKYPGQKNSLDALVKRLAIVTKDRTFHGALLDAEILADVYLFMTGGQVKLGFGESVSTQSEHAQFINVDFSLHKSSESEGAEHTQWLRLMADTMANDDFLENWGLTVTNDC